MADKNAILLESGTNELEVLEFYVNKTTAEGEKIRLSYGINVSKVRKISQVPEFTKIPNQHKSISGVFFVKDIHEAHITCVDLGIYLFDMRQEDYPREAVVIIAEFNQILAAFLVDGINRIHRVSWSDVVPPKVDRFVESHSLVVGVIHVEKRSIMMLDVERIVIDLGLVKILDESKISELAKNSPIIVTAEDSPMIRGLIGKRLKAAGFRIESFNNGQEAWNYLEEAAQKVKDGYNKLEDFISGMVTDIEMPEMDGYTLVKNVKDHEILQDIPVIIFSSMITQDILHKGQSVGADAQLSKPQIGELSDTMMRLTRKNQEDDDLFIEL